MKRLVAAIALFVGLPAHAELDAGDMQLVGGMPIAPRGGVLVARLAPRNATTGWPETIQVALDDGTGRTPLVGRIGWIEPLPIRGNRPWTWSPSSRTIRPPLDTDDVAAITPGDGSTGPYLLVELPEDGAGELVFGRERIPLRWLDLPDGLPALHLGTRSRSDRTLEMVNAPDRPLADNPFTWWRWTLLADRKGLRPPPPPDANPPTLLLSKHIEQLWRIGLHRLADRSRGVAAQCRDLLTCTCRDGDVEFAAWISEATPINELLGILLEPGNDDVITDLALAWADRQIPMVAWIEQAYGSKIVLAIGNPYPTRELAQVLWRNQGAVPIGAALEPGAVTRMELPRPPDDLIKSFYPQLDAGELLHLNLVIRDHVMTLTFGPDAIRAEPPGPLLGPFLPPMTMTTARTQRPSAEPNNRTTWCQVRRIAGRWELFIECQRTGTSRGRRLSSFMRSLDQLRGIEAVTVLVGPPRHERAPARYGICIPEHGEPRIIVGPADDPPEIHIRSYEDRWLARFVLPGYWVPPDDEQLLLSLIRTHQDNLDFETAPNLSVPWSMRTDPVHLDLSAWGDEDFLLPTRRR